MSSIRLFVLALGLLVESGTNELDLLIELFEFLELDGAKLGDFGAVRVGALLELRGILLLKRLFIIVQQFSQLPLEGTGLHAGLVQL